MNDHARQPRWTAATTTASIAVVALTALLLALVDARVALAGDLPNGRLDYDEARALGGPTANRATVRTHFSGWLLQNITNGDFNHAIEALLEVAVPDQTFSFHLTWAATFQADIGTTGVGDVYVGAKWQFFDDDKALLASAKLTIGIPLRTHSTIGLSLFPPVETLLIDLTIPACLVLEDWFVLCVDAGMSVNLDAVDTAAFRGTTELAVLLDGWAFIAGAVFHTDINPVDVTAQVVWVDLGVHVSVVVPIGNGRPADFIATLGMTIDIP